MHVRKLCRIAYGDARDSGAAESDLPVSNDDISWTYPEAPERSIPGSGHPLIDGKMKTAQ